MNFNTSDLPTPNFTYDPQTDLIAGIRPYREVTYRLEPEQVGSKLVVHNYGHGGAGITMALGCAHKVRDIIVESGLATAGAPIAILGGGVMGLTAATVLREMNLNVALYAKAFTNTTSDRAGGQWAPSLVKHEETPAGKQRFEKILRCAFRGYEALIGRSYGVHRRPNYTWTKTASFNKVPHDLIPPPTYLPRLPFQGHVRQEGYLYETLLIEPPVFLGRLRADLRAARVAMNVVDFTSPQQLASLPEQIVVNCLGLGSRRLWQDSKLIPRKGQLILLKPQLQLQYLYSGTGYGGYIFPREDKVVVGGTDESCNEDDTPHDGMCAELIDLHKTAFAGGSFIGRAVPDWTLKDK